VIPFSRMLGGRVPGSLEAGQAVGAAFDHLDLIDDAFGVAVGGRLVEVGEQLGAPEPDAVGEGAEGGELRAVDRAEEALEAALGLVTVGAR
jgi:hypothetical protein